MRIPFPRSVAVPLGLLLSLGAAGGATFTVTNEDLRSRMTGVTRWLGLQ